MTFNDSNVHATGNEINLQLVQKYAAIDNCYAVPQAPIP